MEPISLFRAKPEVEPKQRLQFDNSLRRWFNRNLGLWRSRRQYFFDDDQAMRVDMLLRMEAFSEPVEGEAAYRFTWWPQKEYDFFDKNPRYVREGNLEAYLCGHQLRRSRGYLCGSPTKSQIRQVDEHELVFESHYLSGTSLSTSVWWTWIATGRDRSIPGATGSWSWLKCTTKSAWNPQANR